VSARGFLRGEAVRRCRNGTCGHVMVARVGDACPRCNRAFTDDKAPEPPHPTGLPVGFVLAGSWPPLDGGF